MLIVLLILAVGQFVACPLLLWLAAKVVRIPSGRVVLALAAAFVLIQSPGCRKDDGKHEKAKPQAAAADDAQDSRAPATAPAGPTVRSAMEAFAMEAQLLESSNSCRTPAVPEEVIDLLRKHADANSTDHLPYLVEYGLRIHWKLLQHTGMARELPVQDNLALSELVRVAEIPKYRTAHEAGWLDRQFDGPFGAQGWSSYQVYVWVKEHDILVAGFPNAARIAVTLQMIDSSDRNGLGGDGRCHYGCQ